MKTERYRIAGVTIEISSCCDDIHNMCRNYRVAEVTTRQEMMLGQETMPENGMTLGHTASSAEIIIETNQADIDFERERAIQIAKIEGEPDRKFTDGYLETIAVHRKLATQMLWRDILLFHGSAVAVDGQVYLFTAKSGTGKSTHASLWRQKFGERAVMVNDDKPMLKVYGTGVGVCGTPWNGKHHLDTNTELPLKAICIIHQDRENHIEPISTYDAIPALWLQVYRRVGAMDTEKILQLLGSIAEHVPLYRMGCNMDPEAADVAWEGMHG